jgi:hypothetical protein
MFRMEITGKLLPNPNLLRDEYHLSDTTNYTVKDYPQVVKNNH